jgi:hypothetical protein
MLDLAREAFTEQLTPGSEFFEPTLDSRLIGKVVGASGKGIDSSQRVTLVARHKA